MSGDTGALADRVHAALAELFGHLGDELGDDDPIELDVAGAVNGRRIHVRRRDAPVEYALLGRPGRSVGARYERDGDFVIVTTFRAGRPIGEERFDAQTQTPSPEIPDDDDTDP